jgi:CHAT domain-containing protein
VELDAAADRFASLGLTERAVAALAQRAGVALEAKDLPLAERVVARARVLLRASMNPMTETAVALVEAHVDLAAGRPADALRRAEAAAVAQGRALAPWADLDAAWVSAKALLALGREPEALAAYERAIETLERYRGGVPPDEYMAAFLAGRAGLYQEVVDLLVRRGDAARSFHYAERAKSRALVELLAGREAADGAGPRDEATARRVALLRERLNAIYRRLARPEGEGGTRSARACRRARHEASRIEGEVGRLLREGRLAGREAASLVGVDAPALEAVQAELDADTTLVEYFLTGDAVVTFVVTRETVRVVRRDARAQDLRAALTRFHFHLSKLDREDVVAPRLLHEATRANLALLADVLLAPVADALSTRRLVVVPHGMLHHVPFHALPLGEGWVTDRFEVLYAPSAAVWSWCRRARATGVGSPVVLGLPDEAAPRIADEAARVAALLRTPSLHLREDATFDRLREACRTARLVHVATHGMFRADQPMLSAVRLADRWVNLYDVYGLDVRAELVVLSTCESGIADVTEGDEILGLARGFLYAGAPALLASQWRVDDDATALFMEAFYEALEAGADAAAAHRRAIARTRETYAHPYYWAAFFLTGRPLAGSTRAASGSTSDEPLPRS